MGNEERLAVASDFGTLLRHHRLAAGLSLESLADRARMSANGIGALERGYRRTPQFETLALLIGALALTEEQRRVFVAAAARSGTVRGGSSVSVGPWPETCDATLPIALNSFIGRADELEEIPTLMRAHRLVTLTGAGGIGKTRTAVEAARTIAESLESTALFVGLAALGDASLVAQAIAQALGVQDVPNRPPLETLQAYLKHRSLLVVLDNCEHVALEAARVAESLLKSCGGVRILATSREPLGVPGEQRYLLRSLSASDAVALFGDRASAVDHRFTITHENQNAVERICGSVDRIPLAIELAAAHVNAFSVTTLAAMLGDQLQLLRGGERTAEPRLRTMRATIDWSYSLLSAPEQRIFERMSVFAGGCTLEDLTKVCADKEIVEGDVPEVIRSLVGRSMALADLEEPFPRYRLLEPFRQYARERLSARGEDQVAAARHARAFLDLAVWVDRAVDGERYELIRARSAPELHNLRSALEWSLAERRDVLLGQRMAAIAARCFFSITERRRWLALALAAVTEQTPANVIAALKLGETTIAVRLFETKRQFAFAQDALERYRELNDPIGIEHALICLGDALIWSRRPQDALPVLEEALSLARRLGLREGTGHALRLLAQATEEISASRRYLAESLHIFEAMGRTDQVAFTLSIFASCEFRAGHLDLALRRSAEAHAASTPSGQERIVVLNWHARYLLEAAQFDEAEESSRELLLLGREQGVEIQVAWTLDLLAAIAVLRPKIAMEAPQRSYANAARLLGFVDARLVALDAWRDFIEQPQHERVMAKLGDELGTDVLSDLMVTGAALTEDRAVELVELLEKR